MSKRKLIVYSFLFLKVTVDVVTTGVTDGKTTRYGVTVGGITTRDRMTSGKRRTSSAGLNFWCWADIWQYSDLWQ